jgi:hypothetical protein
MHKRFSSLIPAAALALVACKLESTTVPLNSLHLEFCSNIKWAAYQSGVGPWQHLADADGGYTIPTENRLGIAWVTEDTPQFPTLHVAFVSIEEASLAFFCEDSTNLKTAHGTVAGVGSTDEVNVSLGPAHAFVAAGDTAFSIALVPDGALDLIATRVLQHTGDTRTVANAIIRRSQTIPNGGDISTLDFSAPESFTPGGNTASITNPTGDTISSTSTFFTPTGASAVLGIRDGTTTSAPFFSVPSGLLEQGDIHRATFTTHSANATLIADVYYRTASDNALMLGPDPEVPTFTTEPGGHLRMKAEVASQAIYGNRVHYELTQQPGSAHGETVIFDLTRTWFGGTPNTWSLVLPDFSAVAGWQDAWAPQPGTYAWTELVSGTALTIGAIHDGDVFRTATQSGTTSFSP